MILVACFRLYYMFEQKKDLDLPCKAAAHFNKSCQAWSLHHQPDISFVGVQPCCKSCEALPKYWLHGGDQTFTNNFSPIIALIWHVRSGWKGMRLPGNALSTTLSLLLVLWGLARRPAAWEWPDIKWQLFPNNCINVKCKIRLERDEIAWKCTINYSKSSASLVRPCQKTSSMRVTRYSMTTFPQQLH
jgi:hypothetical protein